MVRQIGNIEKVLDTLNNVYKLMDGGDKIP